MYILPHSRYRTVPTPILPLSRHMLPPTLIQRPLTCHPSILFCHFENGIEMESYNVQYLRILLKKIQPNVFKIHPSCWLYQEYVPSHC